MEEGGETIRDMSKSGVLTHSAVRRQETNAILKEIRKSPLKVGYCLDTPTDEMLLRHYLYRLSTVLTLEPKRDNAYRALLLPKALQHQGLMHSILALAGKHIHYNDPAGQRLLLEYPDLPARIDHHAHMANALLNADIDSGNAHSMTLAANIGQILCKVLECLADGRTTNEHRIHLECYQRLIREVQPQDKEFMGFVSEFFDYHVSHTILSLVLLPISSHGLNGST